MTSPTYNHLVSLVEPFLGRTKAETIIASQISRCNATPESLTALQVRKIINYLCGATTIHLAGNRVRQDELAAALRGFAAGAGTAA
jgi:hypothetical protein